MRTTRKPLKLAALPACLLLTSIGSAQTFTSFDFPGAINTQATAITPSGDIVGRYNSADGNLHGFLLSGGKFMSIDDPNGTQTSVNWINPSGQVVGDYIGHDGNNHGFLLSRGNFTGIDYPGALDTFVSGISPSGDIVGFEFQSDGSGQGFLLTRQSGFSSIDFPGALLTLATMTTGNRIIGGYYDASFASHGFSLSGGTFQTINCPNSTNVFLSGLNPQGDMTGEVIGTDGIQHGLLVSDGSCIIVDFPGSKPGSNYANGINPRGDIVGRYTTSDGVTHGYLRSGH
jgi:hypothetical protein